MPEFLPRIVQVLRIVNYGPNLTDLIRHNIVTQIPITSDLLYHISTTRGPSEWNHLNKLDLVVRSNESNQSVGSNNDDNVSPSALRSKVSVSSSPSRSISSTNGDDADDIMNELLAAFSPNLSAPNRVMDFTSMLNVVNLAQNLG
jgi:hypothetical protein